jgi:N-acetylated-alpha-linked acidic dipeptidase
MFRRLSRAGFGGAAILAVFTLTAAAQTGESSAPALGFAPASRAGQTRAEAHALAVPTPGNARAWLRTLTEEPHVAGTPADHKTALFVRDKLRQWGWKTEIVEYEVLLNYPAEVSLTLNKPNFKPLPIFESYLPVDKDSASRAAFTAFHGYGASGNSTGQVVYANYGRPEDFDTLEKLGIDVRGKIVLARYGSLFRGLKVRNAQKRGAAGILIYSDPGDDGYARGDIYPAGPFRPGSAIQRGSVQFLSLGPGDPSTPHGPSVKGAKRLPIDPVHGFPVEPKSGTFGLGGGPGSPSVKDWEKATGLVREDYFATIPSLPISYDAARPILENLAGPNVPPGWQGGLPFAYHVGPGAAEVGLSVRMEYKLRPIWNVIATLEGSAEPDRWVLLSNHRDAWVYGAVDPGSGTAATLETCRALGSAVKHGWKPRRTLVYASWDAEEYGLVGSTEWAEEHARELDEKAVLMLNVDSAVSGHDLDVDGVPSLRDLLLDAAGAVTDVRAGQSLRKVWVDKQRAQWASQAPVDLPEIGDEPESSSRQHDEDDRRFSPKLAPLGSGSDYTAFVDHLGVPALDVGFSGRYGVYHSIYDDFTWMEKHGDPEFLTHTMAARLYTIVAMRAAGAEVLPLRFVPYAEALRDEVDDLRRLVVRKARGLDPEHEHGHEHRQPARAPKFAGLPRLARAVAAFRAQAEALDRASAELAERDGVPAARLARVNDALQRVERSFLLADGLPGRPWFKHAIYAPGLTTGYASWPLPGVRQAVLENNQGLFTAQLPVLIERIHAATAAMKAAEAAARDR